MPKVYSVKKCRKSPGQCGKCGTKIEKGKPYVFWAFMVGGKGGPNHIRCGQAACYPKPSDLTQSEFWSGVYSLQETGFSGDTIEDLESSRDGVVSELQSIKDELENRLGNMPDGLQQGSTGELLQERIDALDSVISELESADISFDEPEKEEEESDEEFENRKTEELESRCEEIRTELEGILEGISCS